MCLVGWEKRLQNRCPLPLWKSLLVYLFIYFINLFNIFLHVWFIAIISYNYFFLSHTLLTILIIISFLYFFPFPSYLIYLSFYIFLSFFIISFTFIHPFSFSLFITLSFLLSFSLSFFSLYLFLI